MKLKGKNLLLSMKTLCQGHQINWQFNRKMFKIQSGIKTFSFFGVSFLDKNSGGLVAPWLICLKHPKQIFFISSTNTNAAIPLESGENEPLESGDNKSLDDGQNQNEIPEADGETFPQSHDSNSDTAKEIHVEKAGSKNDESEQIQK